MTFFRVTAKLFLALVVLLISASRAEADVRDEVVKTLASEPRRADLIVVLDTSGSMATHFADARSFAVELAKLARPGDTLTFIGFADQASELAPLLTVRAGARTKLLSQLNKMRPPKAPHTDLGAGLEALLDALLRPDYAPLSLVFMITDFCSEPRPQSPFAGPREATGPCRQVRVTSALRKKSARLLGGRDQSVKVFALALEPSNEAGLRAAASVLGPLVRIDVGASDLRRALDGIRTRIEYERATLTVEQMLTNPPLSLVAPDQPIPLQGERELSLRVRSSMPFASSLRVKSLKVLDESLDFELATKERAFELAAFMKGAASAGTALPVRVRRVSTSAASTTLQPGEDPFHFARDVELELAVDLTLSPRTPLEKLLGKTPQASTAVRQKLRLRFAPPDATEAPLSVQLASARMALAPQLETPVELVFKSLTSWAPLEALCELRGARVGPISLAVNGTHAHALVIKNEARARPWRLRTTEERSLPVKGSCTVSAIAADGTKVVRGTYPIALSLTLTWTEGLPAFPVLLVLTLFLLAVAAYVREVRLRVAPATLSGRLVIYAGPGPFRRVTVPLDGRVSLALHGAAVPADTGVRLDGDRLILPGLAPTHLSLYLDASDRRKRMRLKLLSGEAALGKTPLGASPVLVHKGRADFSLGDYRCRIER
jgi:hypothetical protein